MLAVITVSLTLIRLVAGAELGAGTGREIMIPGYDQCNGQQVIPVEATFGAISVTVPYSDGKPCTWILPSAAYPRIIEMNFNKVDLEYRGAGDKIECVDTVKIKHMGKTIKTVCGSTVPTDMSATHKLQINQAERDDSIEIVFDLDVFPNFDEWSGFELVFQEVKTKAVLDTRLGAEPLPEDKSSLLGILITVVVILLAISLILFIKYRGNSRLKRVFRQRVDGIEDGNPNVHRENLQRYSTTGDGTISSISAPDAPTIVNSRDPYDMMAGAPLVQRAPSVASTQMSTIYGPASSQAPVYGNIQSDGRQRMHSTALSESQLSDQLELSRQATMTADVAANSSRPLPVVPERKKSEDTGSSSDGQDDTYVSQLEIDNMRNSKIQEGRYGYAPMD